MMAHEVCLESEALSECLLALQNAIKSNDCEKLRQILMVAVSDYKPHSEYVDHFADGESVNNGANNVVKIK
jgi:hypothetical protein